LLKIEGIRLEFSRLDGCIEPALFFPLRQHFVRASVWPVAAHLHALEQPMLEQPILLARLDIRDRQRRIDCVGVKCAARLERERIANCP
jgi:hypothetical protein